VSVQYGYSVCGPAQWCAASRLWFLKNMFAHPKG
jgi:hypothetical protein